MVHPASLNIDELLAACDTCFTRRSGPGGQNRNKVETAVVLTHRPTGISAQASEQRTQADNRREAVWRLRLRLAVDLREAPSDEPSSLWQQRSANNRLSVSDQHADFPSLLAEALDTLAAEDHVASAAAERLKVSTSQLVGLLRMHPPALAILNAARSQQGKPPLR